ncbi:winged helix-turn-helix domain-containing protein [Ideonella livida]|uniref:Response regulator transcription factor n=1 Tax=Ideonella livida TaxID=2707176 RepID=A0A7C9PGJ0_9BURK|nr:response regulator transcription factor [Ideonella livida]NDY91333.1 response regulator transcription factor [Ideonella livida]
MRLLLVEDDKMIGDSLRAVLRLEGWAVDWVRDLHAAQAALDTERFDLLLVDRGLPHGGPVGSLPPGTPAMGDGLTLIARLRARGDATPALLLTARDAPGDRVNGLDTGADDYLVKPFEVDELLARMRAVLRRHAGQAQPLLRHGPVTLNPATRQVSLKGQPVLLSAKELAVLEALMQRPGAVLSRAQLEDRLYGWGEEIESNAVSVYVHQLRRKLGADFIGNQRGLGYYLNPVEAA